MVILMNEIDGNRLTLEEGERDYTINFTQTCVEGEVEYNLGSFLILQKARDFYLVALDHMKAREYPWLA